MRARLGGLLVLVLLASSVGVVPASSPTIVYAASFTVNDTADAIDADTNDGMCLTGTATCTLRAAIMQANASAGADIIVLPPGTYTLSLPGTNEDNSLTGDLDIRSVITINGAGASSTTIDANGIDQVLELIAGSSLSLLSVTVRGGSTGGIVNHSNLSLDSVVVTANASSGLAQEGLGPLTLNANNSTFRANTAPFVGGLFLNGGLTTITGGVIEDNVSEQGAGGMVVQLGDVTMSGTLIRRNHADVGVGTGGGIWVLAGTLRLTNVTLSENTATTGGGIYNEDQLTLTNVTLTNNQSTGEGGGLANFRVATIVDSVFSGNHASDGGGLAGLNGTQFNVNTTLTNTTFTGNQATHEGGAIWNGSTLTMTGGSVTGNSAPVGGPLALVGPAAPPGPPFFIQIMNVSGTTVQNNLASQNGGGIYMFGYPKITLTDLSISGNQAAGNGGAIYNASPSTPAVNRTTIDGNSASGGGGIWSQNDINIVNSTISVNSAGPSVGGGLANLGGVATLTNVTLNGNTTPFGNGGNVFSAGGGVTFRNTIVANGNGGNCNSSGGTLTSSGGNLESSTGCQFTLASDLRNTNPLLGPLANNGGATKTHALQSGSPAIDGGINTGCPNEDQRQQPRPRDGNNDGQYLCDVGSFEAPGAFPPPAPTATPTVTPVPTLCSPRPRVVTQPTPTGDGRLQVTVSATSNAGTTNALQAITWGTFSNATVQVNGIGPVTSGQRTTLPAGTASVVFVISRGTPGQASTVSFTATDACGDFPSFAGGGPSAF